MEGGYGEAGSWGHGERDRGTRWRWEGEQVEVRRLHFSPSDGNKKRKDKGEHRGVGFGVTCARSPPVPLQPSFWFQMISDRKWVTGKG